MPRLFTGLELPDALKHQLLALQKELPRVRWQTADQLHLTLNFIGDVDESWLEAIHAALAELPVSPFEATVAGAGRFGKSGRPQTLWVGVTPAAPLVALHESIRSRLTAIGLQLESRTYRPHITIGRLRRPSRESADFITALAGLVSPSFPVTRASLFQSTQGEAGSRYEVIERYPFSG